MNKYVSLFLLSLVLIAFSCEDDDGGGTPLNEVRQIAQQAELSTEVFKLDHTIQFDTATYTGQGAVGFEGLFFSKTRIDNRAMFVYNYCNPLFCTPFGDQTLPAQLPDELALEDPLLAVQQDITLDQRIEYRNGDQTVGYLYFRSCEPGLIIGNPEVDGAYGRYFMRRPGTDEFVEGLDIVFDYALREEVFTIVGTVVAVD